MSRDRFDVLERFEPLFDAPEPSFDGFLRRRDRKRRSQRIAAGVVGIAVFVAAVVVVTSVGSLDRSETSVVPGQDVTGPAETGPTATETGPIGTGPPAVSQGWSDAAQPEYALPPDGAAPSTPREGQLVDQFTGCCPSRWVYVYADGRVIAWQNSFDGRWLNRLFEERRLTPDGVGLVRSGAVEARNLMSLAIDLEEVPTRAWEDPTPQPYVPSSYSVCLDAETSHAEPHSTLVNYFPARARAILGNELPGGCTQVTTDQARALLNILGTMSSFEMPTFDMIRVQDSEGREIYWDIRMMLPHGAGYPCPGCG